METDYKITDHSGDDYASLIGMEADINSTPMSINSRPKISKMARHGSVKKASNRGRNLSQTIAKKANYGSIEMKENPADYPPMRGDQSPFRPSRLAPLTPSGSKNLSIQNKLDT